MRIALTSEYGTLRLLWPCRAALDWTGEGAGRPSFSPSLLVRAVDPSCGDADAWGVGERGLLDFGGDQMTEGFNVDLWMRDVARIFQIFL